MPETPAFTSWLDRFFDAYYDARPVNATFIGVHDLDHRLPDLSENGAGDTLSEMERLLRMSMRLDPDVLTPAEALDLRLSRGFLRTQIWEYGSSHFHRGNPSVYTGEALFGVISLFLTPFAPLAERVDAATARMEAIPEFLEQGRESLARAPRAWTERGLRECTAGRALLIDGIDSLCATEGIQRSDFKEAATRAAAALGDFATFLETELLPRGSEEYGCGEEALALYLREGHFLADGADEIARYAEGELALARARLEQHAPDFGATSPEQALAGLEAIHPPAESYEAACQALWEEIKAKLCELDLVRWPDLPIHFVTQPPWTRAAASHLYFLAYRAPAAFSRPAVHEYLLGPVPAGTQEERERWLRLNNQSVIKLNHVVHHGGLGHHVQNGHASSAASRIGRVAGIDCASRIALFCGGTMAEGWACYATDLAAEAGLLTPLEQYAEQHARLRMCARAVVDVRLHQGRLSLAEAALFYEREAGLSPAGARAEAVKNSMFPGAAVMYVMGCDAIHALRRELSTRSGFALRAFHDALLAYGSVPVALVADIMKRQAADAQ